MNTPSSEGPAPADADAKRIVLFPIEKFDQRVERWLDPAAADYKTPLLSAAQQQAHLELWLQHAVGALSPWSASYIARLLDTAAPHDLATIVQRAHAVLSDPASPDHRAGYGKNFRPHPRPWYVAIQHNLNLAQFSRHAAYDVQARAIATDNLLVRALPTNDVHFYDHRIAGQGFPFDNLQVSAIWAGTPLYVLGSSADGGWKYVASPDSLGWVQSNSVGHADQEFVERWSAALALSPSAACRQTPVADSHGHTMFDAYIGSVYPRVGDKIMIPVMHPGRIAAIDRASIAAEDFAVLPLPSTPQNFARLLRELQGRPYGWGNAYFYNDCSAETKSLFTPFGIWLPRHSSRQATAGETIDLSALTDPVLRQQKLVQLGTRLLTLIVIDGHVALYLGNDGAAGPMSYQSVWGLHAPHQRSVIGQSVFLPLATRYDDAPGFDTFFDTPSFKLVTIGDAISWPTSACVDIEGLADSDEPVL